MRSLKKVEISTLPDTPSPPLRTFLGRILTHASEPSLPRPPPPAAALRVRILELRLDAERVGHGGRAAVAGAGEVTRMRSRHLVLGQVDTLQRVGGLVTALRVSLVHTLSLYNIRWMIFLVIAISSFSRTGIFNQEFRNMRIFLYLGR